MRKFLIATAAGAALLAASATVAPASASDFNNNPLGLFIGAAAGGLIGSQIGQGQGRIVATAAGTFIGAMIGANAGSYDRDYRTPTYARPAPRTPSRIWADYGDYRDARGTTVYVDNRTYITNTSTTVTQTTVRHDYDRDYDRNRHTRWSRY